MDSLKTKIVAKIRAALDFDSSALEQSLLFERIFSATLAEQNAVLSRADRVRLLEQVKEEVFGEQ